MEEEKKICDKCGIEKHPYHHKSGRIQWVCKPCRNKRARKWRKENPEEAARISRHYARLDRKKNPLRQREANRRYREKHPERYLQQKRECDKKYRDKRNKSLVEYRKNNFEKCRAHDKIKYAIKKGKIKKSEKCEFCGEKEKLHGHHENYEKPLEVIWLCSRCHVAIHKMNEIRKSNEIKKNLEKEAQDDKSSL